MLPTLGSLLLTPAMRRVLPLTALCALLCAPAVASAATNWSIKGAGWGHGIGMSQYGAFGQAKIGRNYQQILASYYTGTIVSTTRSRTIRVLLQASVPRVTFGGATSLGGRAVKPGTTYGVTRAGSSLVVKDPKGKLVGRFAAVPLKVSSSRGNTLLNGRMYRGTMELRPGTAGGVTAVNALSLDNYVQGVVPAEMPSSWSSEALKAQAVAARTYALTTDAGGTVFDQFGDARSQVYGGVGVEAASSNAAVRGTSNQIVTTNGRAAVTYFFSTSGGKTEDLQNVFYGALAVPYLKSVDDPYDKIAPRHRWTLGPYSDAQISRKFGSYCAGSFKGLTIRQRGSSPRIVRADVVCSGGTRSATGAGLRSAMGLYDTWFSVVGVTTNGTKRAKWLVRSTAKVLAPRAISGSVGPGVSAGSVVTVQRRMGGGWRSVASGRTVRGGGYDVRVMDAGTYRVRVAGVTGPVTAVQ
jgi:stage II sporulation protein D